MRTQRRCLPISHWKWKVSILRVLSLNMILGWTLFLVMHHNCLRGKGKCVFESTVKDLSVRLKADESGVDLCDTFVWLVAANGLNPSHITSYMHLHTLHPISNLKISNIIHSRCWKDSCSHWAQVAFYKRFHNNSTNLHCSWFLQETISHQFHQSTLCLWPLNKVNDKAGRENPTSSSAR